MVTATGSPTGPGQNWEPVDGDAVGTASARLLAAGISRRDRLDALSLLGLLGDHADQDGWVRLPLSTLAGEFSMPAARARRLLDILVEVGAVLPRPEGLVVAAWQPSAAEGLRLAGFLANVATVFERRADDDDDEVLEDGIVVDLPPRPSGGRARRSREPVLVAAITMVAAVFATLAPTSSPPTALRTVTSASAASAVDEGDPGPDVGPGGERLDAPSPGSRAGGGAGGADAPPGASSASPAVAPTLPMPAPGASGEATAGAPPALGGSAETDERSATPPGPQSGGGTPSPAPGPTGPLGSTPPGGPPAAAPEPVVCPVVEVPYLLVESVLVSPGPTDALAGLAAPAVMEASGTMVNPSESGVVIRSYEITVELDDGPATLPGSPSPLTVPAAGERAWRMTTTVPAGSTVGEGDVAARVLQWEWLDDAVAEACPT